MTPIAITGMHRTGSSMVARMLRMAGLHLGADEDFVEPAPDNPEGFFEHAGFVRLNDELLEAAGGAWDHPPPAGPLAADEPRVAQFGTTARELIAALGTAETWGWKDPRTCLTAPFWIDLVPDLRFVICVRHPLEVALSLKRRNQVSYALGLSLWQTYFDRLLEVVPEDRRIVTHYDSYFDDGTAAIGRVVEFVGLPTDRIRAARPGLSRELRHHQLDLTLAEAGTAPAVIDRYRQLCEEAGRPPERPAPTPGAVQLAGAVVDLAAAKQQLERHERRTASLERERDELSARVAELDAEAAGAADLQDVCVRLDSLEEAFHRSRYAHEDLALRSDAPVIRSCRRLVHELVPPGEEILVIAKGDTTLLDLYGRPAGNFPRDETGAYPGFPPADGTAAVAHLEALRTQGARYLLVPDTARWWIDDFTPFGQHLARRYEIVADEPGAGLLVDVRAARRPVHGWPSSLAAAIDRVTTAGDCDPAILDWTPFDLRALLPHRNVFELDVQTDQLPYLDRSVDVVVVEDGARLEEARRVAALAVVVMERPDGSGPLVSTVEVVAAGGLTEDATATLVVVRDAEPDPIWLAHLDDALGDRSRVEILATPDLAMVAEAAATVDLVAFLDEWVVPLPGCFAAAAAAFEVNDRSGAVAAKVFAPDGALEAAGAMVFADGTWEGVAARSHAVTAPWHEFLRATCWGPGLTVFTSAAVDKLAAADVMPAGPAVWSADLWATGLTVLYQPEARAVRLRRPRAGNERADEAVAKAWSRALPHRPARPAVLDDGAWKALVARDDVEAGWR